MSEKYSWGNSEPGNSGYDWGVSGAQGSWDAARTQNSWGASDSQNLGQQPGGAYGAGGPNGRGAPSGGPGSAATSGGTLKIVAVAAAIIAVAGGGLRGLRSLWLVLMMQTDPVMTLSQQHHRMQRSRVLRNRVLASPVLSHLRPANPPPSLLPPRRVPAVPLLRHPRSLPLQQTPTQVYPRQKNAGHMWISSAISHINFCACIATVNGCI